MINNDEEAIWMIEKLYGFEIKTEEEWAEVIEQLENYVPGCTEVIRVSKELIKPDEVLKKAREQNQPILL